MKRICLYNAQPPLLFRYDGHRRNFQYQSRIGRQPDDSDRGARRARPRQVQSLGSSQLVSCRSISTRCGSVLEDHISALSSSLTIPTGASSDRRAKVASNTRLCWAISFGLPRVAPRASLVKVALGGAVSLVTPAFQVVRVAAMPSISRARATSPTDWAQSGQAGTRRAALTPCTLAASTMPGTNSSKVRTTSG